MTSLLKDLQVAGVSRPTVLNDGFPVKDVLLANTAPVLETIVGPFRSVSEYLDCHYKLLSEDFIRPLRESLIEYKHTGCPGNKVRVFKAVSFSMISSDHHRGNHRYVNCVLDLPDNAVQGIPKFGSLLVFSQRDFQEDLFLGKVVSDRNKSENKIVIEVELKLPMNQGTKELTCCQFTMIEGEAFYYMYYHILKVLNLLSEQSFPMKKYIVYGTAETQMNNTSYLTGISSSEYKTSNITDMDESQFSALKASLSNELAVIHGGPGTGKTYFGIRLVKVFLDNVNVWKTDQCKPILIVCQSNPSLDHFMENLLEYTKKIVRIGDECQSDRLKPYSLKELVCRHLINTSENSAIIHPIKSVLADIDRIRLEIQKHQHGRSNINSAGHRQKLESAINEMHNIWDGLPNKYAISLQVLRSAFVVGLTSTAAAARRQHLEELRSPIVIIEEAGEMLEAHVVVSMTEHCRHLIMLGDRKQLKPMVNTFALARDFNLNTSLFERLLANEIVEGNCLTMQYRMRPEISSLLKPHIYEILLDSPVTLQREKVRGLTKNVFFLNHQNEEQKAKENHGWWNLHEVNMLVNLAYYLVVFQKYSPADIAIITPYTKQMEKLKEARDRDSSLLDVEVACVDSFQGREKEIILLSLVRSNSARKIGFLEEENRIGVALSRARSGLYIMGNMDCLQSNSVWNEVRCCLERNDQIGSKLTLNCEEHDTSREVSQLLDWNFRFCKDCHDTTRAGYGFDRPVYLNIPENPRFHVFRCDYKQEYRRDFNRDYWRYSNRTAKGECLAKTCGVLLGAATFILFLAFIWFFVRRM